MNFKVYIGTSDLVVGTSASVPGFSAPSSDFFLDSLSSINLNLSFLVHSTMLTLAVLFCFFIVFFCYRILRWFF